MKVLFQKLFFFFFKYNFFYFLRFINGTFCFFSRLYSLILVSFEREAITLLQAHFNTIQLKTKSVKQFIHRYFLFVFFVVVIYLFNFCVTFVGLEFCSSFLIFYFFADRFFHTYTHIDNCILVNCNKFKKSSRYILYKIK